MRLVAQNGISHVVVVRRLHTVKQNHVLQFHGVAHNGILAHNGAAANERTMPHLCAVVNDAGRADVCRGKYLCVLGNPYALLRVVKFLFRQRGPQLQNEVADLPQNFPRVGLSGKYFCRDRFGQVQQFLNFHAAFHCLFHLD